MCIRRVGLILILAATAVAGSAVSARAQDRLCDPAAEDCRIILLNLIRNETVGIDVGFWFMEDARYSNELVKKHAAGVPIRVLMDPRANSSYPLNAQRLTELQTAGIPMRKRVANGILHYKMMLFAGQGTLEFSGANYSSDAWRPEGTPYTNYTDEVIYFTDDASVVNSFRTKFDDLWTNTTAYANYANVTGALVRRYDTFPKNPELNFPPTESFASRSVSRYNAETAKIDVIMYRITDRRHTDAMIAARGRGIPVRLITEPEQYRDESRLWHSWNVDRLYMAGVKIKHRAHAGLNHQKSVLLYGLGLSILGSSNWTSPSSSSQEEHNYFTTKPFIFNWLVDQFERKWNNSTGLIENVDFVPLPPDRALTPEPANLATGVGTTVKLTWFGGPWAHKYDVYFGTSSNPPLLASDLELGPSENSRQMQSYTVPFALSTGTTYYWRVVSKTMANMTKASDVWTFTTAGSAAPPPAGGSAGVGDVVLYAGKATVRQGSWGPVSDASAAGGVRMSQPNAGAAKVTSPAASPANYFEMSFQAEANKPYRLWIRARATSDHYSNDSIYIQFSGSVTSGGSPTWRIGTTSATEMNLEDCSGCGLSGWGWQDNGWGVNVLGPLVYFGSSGTHTIRIQNREDGIQIDQIVLSKGPFLSTAPGAVKNDNTILSEQGGTASSEDGDPPPPPPASTAASVILYASDAAVVQGGWTITADSSAAGGSSIRQADAGAAKITAASANPANYFELNFTADANTPYRLWIRSKADNNSWANDSVFIQFSGSVTQSGSAIYRIGTTSAAESNLEDCSGCGLSGWGWQDNGWGTNVLGPVIYFATSGPQKIRIQQREDGVAIDQIVLSPSAWLTSSPGALKNDTTILQK